ncbi:MAG: hypothetical protein ACLQNE_45650 [Thermoguttaceae bacterium]
MLIEVLELLLEELELLPVPVPVPVVPPVLLPGPGLAIGGIPLIGPIGFFAIPKPVPGLLTGKGLVLLIVPGRS